MQNILTNIQIVNIEMSGARFADDKKNFFDYCTN